MTETTMLTMPARLWHRYPTDILLLALNIFGIAISVIWLLQAAPNYQEMFNIDKSTHILSAVTDTSPDNPMPLYLILLHAVLAQTGPSLVWARALSLLFYFFLPIMAFFAGRTAIGNVRAGQMAAILISLSPFAVWYSNRATVYGVLIFATLLNLYFFTRILLKRSWSWPGYILSGLIGLGLHYFFAAVLLTQAVFYIVKRNHFKRSSLMKLFFSFLIFGLALGAWVYYSNLHSPLWHHLPYTSKPSATNIFIILVQFLFGFQSVIITTLIIALWPLLVVLALLAVQKYVRPPIAVQYFLVAALLPILGTFTMGWLWRPLFLSSYLIVCLPPFMLFLSWYLVAFNLKVLAWARYVLILVMIVTLFIQLLNPDQAIKGDYLGLLSRYRQNIMPSLN